MTEIVTLQLSEAKSVIYYLSADDASRSRIVQAVSKIFIATFSQTNVSGSKSNPSSLMLIQDQWISYNL